MTGTDLPHRPNPEVMSPETFSGMRDAYNRILFEAPTLPKPGSPHMQEAYEALIARQLDPDTQIRFSDDNGIEMDGRLFHMAGYTFYDEQSGIEVGDKSPNRGYSGGNRLHSNIRMRTLPKEGESRLEATKAWVADFIGHDAAEALEAEYAQLKEWGDRIGEVGFDIHSSRNPGVLNMTVGFADLTNYGDDTGIRGKTYELTMEQARQVSAIFGRQLGTLQRLGDLDVDELMAGTEQVFTQRYKQAQIDQEVQQLTEEFKARYDVNLSGDERADFTREWISKRAEELAQYQPETFRYYSADRVLRGKHQGHRYSHKPKQAALLMAREQAELIQTDIQGGILDVTAMDRKADIEAAVAEDDRLTAITKKAMQVLADDGDVVIGESDVFGYRKTTYEPGLRKEAVDYESIEGVGLRDRATNNHYFIDESGRAVRESRTPDQRWPGGVRSQVVSRHEFSDVNNEKAALLTRRLADKQGERYAQSEWTDRDRESNMALAKRELEGVESMRQRMADQARQRQADDTDTSI